jgi:hypothetical protein
MDERDYKAMNEELNNNNNMLSFTRQTLLSSAFQLRAPVYRQCLLMSHFNLRLFSTDYKKS